MATTSYYINWLAILLRLLVFIALNKILHCKTHTYHESRS